MGIAVHQISDELRSNIARPNAAVREEETLFGRKAFHFLCIFWILLHDILESTEGDVYTSIITDILTECFLSIDFQTWLNLLLAEPVGENFRTLVIVGFILCRPPVAQVSIFVELATLIIESVAHLVTDNVNTPQENSLPLIPCSIITLLCT